MGLLQFHRQSILMGYSTFHLQLLLRQLNLICQDMSTASYTPQNSVWGVYRSQLVGRSVRRSVCSFLSALFLINYWTNFIQTSQVNSVSSRDVHMKCWLWFIDFSLSYGPFMKFLVSSFSHQLLDRFSLNIFYLQHFTYKI